MLLLLSLATILALVHLLFQEPAPPPPPADIAPIIGLITARALALSGPVKIATDRLVQGLDLHGRKPFVLAMVLGVVFDFGVSIIGSASGIGYKFTLQSAVMAIAAGVAAGWMSKVVTDNHESAKHPE